jgi:hypothetical protein
LHNRGWSERSIDSLTKVATTGGSTILFLAFVILHKKLLNAELALTRNEFLEKEFWNLDSSLPIKQILFLFNASAVITAVTSKIAEGGIYATQHFANTFTNIRLKSLSPAETAYKEWATAGALECGTPGLPPEIGLQVAKYLNRNDAEILSKVCKSAHKKSFAAREEVPEEVRALAMKSIWR